MDVWLQPTNENRDSFIKTLLCMNYSEQEVELLDKENFTQPFKATIGAGDASIDLMTFFYFSKSFDEAYLQKQSFEIEKDITADFVSYELLIAMKLHSHREKDLWDIARLDELRNPKNKK